MKVVNLMKHACTIKRDGYEVTIKPSGEEAVVETDEERVGMRIVSEGDIRLQVPIMKRTFGKVTGLPCPKKGTIYLVSSIVLAAVPERNDVFAPDTGPTAERKKKGPQKGHVLSVRRLIGN